MIYLMLQGGSRIICTVQDMILGMDLYDTDPAQNLVTPGQALDDLDSDLSDLSVRRVDGYTIHTTLMILTVCLGYLFLPKS